MLKGYKRNIISEVEDKGAVRVTDVFHLFSIRVQPKKSSKLNKKELVYH